MLALSELQAGAVACVMVLKHLLGVAEGVAWVGRIAHSHPALPTFPHQLAGRVLVPRAAPLSRVPLAICTRT